MIVIPEDKLRRYLTYPFVGQFICECGKHNLDVRWTPYAYNESSDKIIFVAKCGFCNNLFYINE